MNVHGTCILPLKLYLQSLCLFTSCNGLDVVQCSAGDSNSCVTGACFTWDVSGEVVCQSKRLDKELK